MTVTLAIVTIVIRDSTIDYFCRVNTLIVPKHLTTVGAALVLSYMDDS